MNRPSSGCPRRSASSRAAMVMAVAVAAGCIGCGGAGDLHPASGRVLVKGQPAAGATLHFHRQGEAEVKYRGLIPSAVADEDGRFQVSSDLLGAGAPAGKYAVLITWPGDPKEDGPGSTGKAGTAVNTDFKRSPTDRLKGRYSDSAKARFFAEVGPSAAELAPFEIND